MLNIQHSIDLTRFNTLRLNAQTSDYLILNELSQLAMLSQELAKYPQFFVLGGGSNIVLPQEFKGLVIHNQLTGIEISDYSADHKLVTAMAGENWDNFVADTLANGAYGLENLSLIPGTVGASPVQNIGAYGVEVKDFIAQVTVYDLIENRTIHFTNQDCQFTYRNSIFKNQQRYLVISVSFKLAKQAQLNLSYADVAKQMAAIENPGPFELRQYIIATRQSKLPDPALIGNAGSFFHNPIINKSQATALSLKYPKLPIFATANPKKVKISAGWLIDNLGLKGYRDGNLGIYAKQALVIVNYTPAAQVELLVFAAKIQTLVANEYTIQLNIEPIIILNYPHD